MWIRENSYLMPFLLLLMALFRNLRLNMPHDDDSKCNPFKHGLPPNVQAHYVMSRMLDHNTYPWAWSRCSRHYLTEFLE